MLNNFENIVSKSFNDYTSQEELSEVNLFFGINGSGKSALAEWLHRNNEVNTIKFDTKFVDDNLRIKESLDGVILTVGEDEIQREEQINDIETANRYIDGINDTLTDKISDNKNHLYNIIDKILRDTKEEFNYSRVNHKSNTKSNPKKAIERWKTNSEIDIELFHDVSGEIINNKLFELPKLIRKTQPIFTWLNDTTQSNIKNIFDRRVKKLDEEMNNKLLNWLSVGLEVHDMHGDNEICKYCGQSFEVNKIAEKISKQIDTEYKKILEDLSNISENIEKSQQQLQPLDDIFLPKEIDEFEIHIKKFKDYITEKSSDTDKKIDIRFALSEIKKIDNAIKDKNEKYTEELKKYKKLNNHIELVVKKRVGILINENEKVKSLLEKNENIRESLEKNDKAIEENKTQLDIWHDETSELEPFMRLVNEHLKNLGLDFYLSLPSNGESYILGHLGEEVSLGIDDLSEGEIRLLAFLYFYHSSFAEITEDGHKVHSKIETIVIDDPITSLDTNNRYYLTNMLNSYVQQLVGKKVQDSIQIFILTHSSIDFHNICYGFNNQRIKKWNIYKNMDGNSEIQMLTAAETKNYSDYYKSIMIELIDFAKISKKKLTGKRNFLSYGNKGRFILESHARTHYNIENTTSSNIDEIKKCYSIPDEYIDKTILMLDILNSLSHGLSFADDYIPSISAIEVQNAILTLLRILYTKDLHHINAIGEGVEGYSQFKKSKLKV